MIFNTIEEVKEFINGTEAKTLGAVVFVDESGEQIGIPFEEFVKRVGLQKAAEFIFDNQERMTKVSIDKADMEDLMKRFIDDPESLTEEEKTQIYMTLSSLKQADSSYTKSLDFYNFITKFMLDNDSPIFKTYDGLLATVLTYMETALIASSKLKQFEDNDIAMNEIIKEVQSQIIIPDGIDEASLMLGLIHIIGEKFITRESYFSKMNINFSKIINKLGLTKRFLYECLSCENGDCDTCLKKGTENMTDYESMTKGKNTIFDDMLEVLKGPVSKSLSKNGLTDINDIFDDIKKDIPKTTPTPHPETKSANVIDIRARLKKIK